MRKDNNIRKISDRYRNNPLSLTSGGVTVYVKYPDGKIFSYDKIKYPGKFMKKIMELNEYVTCWMDNNK